MKENPIIDWVNPEVKMLRKEHIQYLPLWRDRNIDDEADEDSEKGNYARISMCSAKGIQTTNEETKATSSLYGVSQEGG